jgi:antitoxin ParD1/3/4
LPNFAKNRGVFAMATMNISLPDKLKAFVDSCVAEGNYSNVSDYVRDVIRKEQERRAVIAEIQQAIDEGELSGFVPYDRKKLEQRFEELAKAHRLSKKNAA